MKKLMWVCVMMLVVAVPAITRADVTLGPDAVPDSPSGPPYIFSNAALGCGYELQIVPNTVVGWEWHVPIFTLTNTSADVSEQITAFTFTIGDTAFNFDHLGVQGRDPLGHFSTDLGNDGSYFNSTPDNVDNHIRSDYIHYEFAGFDSGDVFTFMSDVDINGATFPGSVENFRNIFWNNGEFDNSTITVAFSAVPAPGSVLLGSIGMMFVGWLRRRKTL